MKKKSKALAVKREVERAPQKIKHASLILVTVVSVAILTIVLLWVFKSPNVKFLVPEGNASWIKLAEPFRLGPKFNPRSMTVFRTSFKSDTVPARAILSIKAFRAAAVYLDGEVVHIPRGSLSQWKDGLQVDLTGKIASGRHELKVEVLNEKGPPALLAHCEELGIKTGADWEATDINAPDAWASAALVNTRPILDIKYEFPNAWTAFYKILPVLISVFLLISLWTILKSKMPDQFLRFSLRPAHFRWGLLALWSALALNNFFKMPLNMGFDIAGHLSYIQFIADNYRIPLASQGWQMFQAPLFYAVSAILYKAFYWAINGPEIERVMRIIPLLCGVLQVEIAYRMMRTVFPDRDDLQMIGITIASTIPMTFYISQAVGNEPLSGLLSAAVLLLCFKLILLPEISVHRRPSVLLGISLALALLAKATALLLIPIVVVAYLMKTNTKDSEILKQKTKSALIATVAAFAIAGWYYIRNWSAFGTPFVGGWDTQFRLVWWQDPGYRIVEHFYRFGDSLLNPIFSGIHGFWDALYSTFWLDGYLLINKIGFYPPWNYDFLVASAWVAFPIALAILIGFFRPLPGSARRLNGFIRLIIVLHFMAVLYLFISLPIYSTVKATYLLGLVPLMGIFVAAACSRLLNNIWARAIIHAIVGCFAVTSYLSYFIM